MKRQTWSRRTAFRATFLGGVVCLFSVVAVSADDGASGMDRARTMLEQWVETRQLISQEKRDWKLGREILEDRIDLVQREIETLRGKITEAEGSIAEADKKRADLVDENERLKVAAMALSEIVKALEIGTKSMLRRLPDPIRERVKPLSQRVPDDPEETKLSLSERFMNVVGILNEVNRFNSEITVTSEVRSLPDGTSAEVTTLYVGLGHGYYVSPNGELAGVGTATAEAWTWTPANDAAEAIDEAIAILANEKVAMFIRLPIDIGTEGE